MKKIQSSADVFLIKVQALYDIEQQLEKALPKLAEAATDEDLKNGFATHLEETKEHAIRLEHIFEMIGEEPDTVECEGIRGIIKDSEWSMKQAPAGGLRDIMIASSARHAEHYEMAAYLSAVEEAKLLGLADAAAMLTLTLAEEEHADKVLARALAKGLAAAR